MNPIGDIKGFIIDVIRNLLIVFGVGYMGGSLVALTHLDTSTLEKMLPVDLDKSPYVGKKGGFSLTGYGFPYTLYTHDTHDFYLKVMNWLVMTCAIVFSTIRSLFRRISSIPTSKSIYDLLLFYVVPYLLVQLVIHGRSIAPLLVPLIAIYAIFGEYIFQDETLKNGFWYFIAPLSFFYNTFSGKVDEGIINFMVKCFLSFLAFMFGWFSMLFLYPFWWTGISYVAILYYVVFLFFSPLWYGFEKVIVEMGNHRLSLTFIFMILTILSSRSFLASLATAGIVVGSIYMFYLLLKNKFKK